MALNRLLKKTGIYFIGNASAKFIQAALIPIYAFFVSANSLGEYDYYLTLSSIIVIFIFCAIWEAVLKFVLVETDRKKKNIIANNILFVVFICFAFAVLLALVINICDSKRQSVIIFIASMTIANGLAVIWQYFARAYEHIRLYVISGVLSAIINLVCILAFVCVAHLQPAGLVYAYVASQLVIVLVLELRLKLLKQFSFKDVDIKTIKLLFAYTFPLVINLASLSILMGFGRLLIVNYLGPEANGEYVFAMKFAAIVTAVGSVFSMASLEEGILRADSGRLIQYYTKMLNALWRVSLAVGILSLPLIYIFYQAITGTEYESSFYLVPIFVLYAVVALLSTNHGSVFQALGKTRVIALSTAVGLGVTMALSLIFINFLSQFGVALALCIGMYVTLFIRWALGIRLCPYKIRGWIVLILHIAFFITWGVLVLVDVDPILKSSLSLLISLALFLPVLNRGYGELRSIDD